MLKRARTFSLWMVGLSLATIIQPVLADYEFNMPEGVTTYSVVAYDLHMLFFYICVVAGTLVFGTMAYSIMKHRKSLGVEPATFSHSTKAEVIWTIIPIIVLASVAVPAAKGLIFMETTTDSEMTVKITGYQWKWGYEYIEDEIRFISSLEAHSNVVRQLNSGIDPATVEHYPLVVDKPLVIPAETKIRFLITADDVIHSWWVPDFGWKRDAIPGFVNEAWVVVNTPGTYRGQCAELCGMDHGYMPIVVEVKSRDDYRQWVADQKAQALVGAEQAKRLWSRDELIDHGKTVYEQQCAQCHQFDGEGLAPAFPALAGSTVATGPMAEHINVVLNGRSGTAMQAFGRMLNETDIAAAITYTRNAWGNEMHDSVQPRDVQAAKKG